MTARNPWRSERVAASVTHVLSVVVLLVASMGAASAQRPALVGVAKAEVQEVTENRPIIGQLVASVEADVAARIPGIVTEVSFEIGDRVLKDQVLARLDSELIAIERSTAEADVDVAEAGLAVAEAEVKRADVAFKRQAALRQSGAFSRSRFEDLQQELNKARAELSRARAQLLRSKVALALFTYRVTHSEIKAPFDAMDLIRIAIDRPVAVIAAVMMALMFGLVALSRIPIQLAPDVRKPIIVVETSWGGAAPAEVEREIVNPQEEQLKGLEGLDSMVSTSETGQAEITLEFGIGTNMDRALLLVSNRLDRVSGYPSEASEPTLSTSGSDDNPIAWMIITREEGNDRRSRNMATSSTTW
jgi:multidrug efflux pump subunit AcrA (membrane-fusion protein)